MKAKSRQIATRPQRPRRRGTGGRRSVTLRVPNRRTEPDAAANIEEASMLQQAQAVDLKDFFAAAEAREDRWQQLNSLAQSWRRVAQKKESEHSVVDRLRRDELLGLLKELEPLESFWAFPGSTLLR